MRYRLSVRLPDELAEGIEAKVRRTGKTKSEVVREALKLAGVRVVRRDPAKMAELMSRAAALRASQSEPTDVVALLDEVRGGSLRLRLRRLTVPFLEADLAC
jgi:Arc/MetJ-type ribon-helix-helix transcriptional regulator